MKVICTLRADEEADRLLTEFADATALSKNTALLAIAGLLPGICRVCGVTEKHPGGCVWYSNQRSLCTKCQGYLAGQAVPASAHGSRDQWSMVGMIL